jgi:predicted PurR-regulated permease PerM
LTPLLVFVAAIVGVEFAGLLGALVAIPAATIIKILVEDQINRRGWIKAGDVKY